MEAKVLVAFVGRAEGMHIYHEGDTFSGSAERIAELAAGGFVEAPKPKSTRKPKAQKKADVEE